MMKDKQHPSHSSSPEQKESKSTLKDLSGIKTLDFGNSQGFACDAETGICGPVTQGKEENE